MVLIRPIFSKLGATIDKEGRIILEEEIDDRTIWSINKIEYYCNSPKVTVYCHSGHKRTFPNGIPNSQARLFSEIPNNFDQVLNKRGNHRFYLRKPYVDSLILIPQQYFIARK